MPYFAEINNLKEVQRVIIADLEFIKSGSVGDPDIWVETFPESDNFAGPGYTYDQNIQRFISKKPFNSWILDADGKWQPPIPKPTDGTDYCWDENLCNFIVVGDN